MSVYTALVRNWWQLRSVGNLKFLKLSYLALASVPFLRQHEYLVQFLGVRMWFLTTVFFASVALALANLIYDIECPHIIKRFESPNDLYARMLHIKRLSLQLYPGDDFDATLAHCKTAYVNQSYDKPFWRIVCSLLYLGSGLLYGVVLGYRLLVVSQALLSP